ncbi:MAG: threonylcarbamoyl-AMP synthase [Chitinophagales bacterium]|nr:threonylcarbamoyl-AMP synthase [Chitinophagales bacterium]
MRLPAEEASEFLTHGKVIAVPTETVYGLAALATNPQAIAKVFEIKNRPADNPLICHFYSLEQIEKFAASISGNTRFLIKHFSPGPISYLIDLPSESPLFFATCGRKQMIARIPDHPVFLTILKKINVPLAAPSANTSGRVSPTSIEMVEKDLGNNIDGSVDGGYSKIGLESTIIDARSVNQIIILRPGAIGETEIQTILPDVSIQRVTSANSAEATPGSRYTHYAPKTPIYWLPEEHRLVSNAIILHTDEQLKDFKSEQGKYFSKNNIHLVSLGSVNNLPELAQHFYERLSSIDLLQLPIAFMLKVNWGNSSLSKAIENRMDKIIQHSEF